MTEFTKPEGAELVAVLDIGGTKIAGALVAYPENGGPQIVFKKSVPTEPRRGGDAVLQTVVETARTLIDLAGGADEIVGVGIDAAGVVNPKDGSILYANDIMPGWTGQPLQARLEQEFGVAVAALGDVHAHALGEARWGIAKGYESCLMVGVGTGLGGALVVNGHVLRGFHGAAGHIGHTLHPAAAGIPCVCGRDSHAETITSGMGLSAIYQGKGFSDELDPALMGDTISARAEAGEEHARTVLHDAGFALGQAIGSWCNLFDPACVVLSGTVTSAYASWREGLDEGVKAQIMTPLADTPIIQGKLEGNAPLIGAAEHLRDAVIEQARQATLGKANV